MSDAGLRLFEAVRARLLAHAPLTALIGQRVTDGLRRGDPVPSLALEDLTTKDASGQDAPLESHTLTLTAYSRKGGRTEALTIAAAAIAALATPPTLTGHRLVLLDVTEGGARIARDRITAEARLTLNALTEPL